MTQPNGRNDKRLGRDLRILSALERKILWLASWTVHHANHIRYNIDGMKVGGHQASSASLATIMTALYFYILRPQDRVAVKPQGWEYALHKHPACLALKYGSQARRRAMRETG